MKLKYKLFLICILFLGFIIFNNSDSYAYTYTATNMTFEDLKHNKYTGIDVRVNIPDEIFREYPYVYCFLYNTGKEYCSPPT